MNVGKVRFVLNKERNALIKEGKDHKSIFKLIFRIRNYSAMTKNEKTKRQIRVYKTELKTLKNKQHEPPQNLNVVSPAPDMVSTSCSTCDIRLDTHIKGI